MEDGRIGYVTARDENVGWLRYDPVSDLIVVGDDQERHGDEAELRLTARQDRQRWFVPP